MNLARLLRFFGLRPRHAPGYRARLSLRMSRVFHRRSSAARRSAAMAADARTSSVGTRPDPQASWPVVEVADSLTSTSNNHSAALNPMRRRRLGSTLYIPENTPVALDWGRGSHSDRNNSNHNSTNDQRTSSRAHHVDAENRLLVQRLILEELLKHHHRHRRHYHHYSNSSKQPIASLAEHAEALSVAFLEAQGSELLPPPLPHVSSSHDPSRGDRNGSTQQQPRLTRKEEKKLRKSVARAVHSDEKQRKKREKLQTQRLKQYARAQAFFEQTRVDSMQDMSVYRASLSRRNRFDSTRADARWRRLSSSESLSSSFTQFSTQKTATCELAPSGSKPPRMEFLFFGGSSSDAGDVSSMADLEFGYRRDEPSVFV